MPDEFFTICLPMPLKLGSVNCYLIKTGKGFLLVDSGAPANRARLESELDRLGCHPGDLQLILITHGDFDHTGCAAYLRKKYGAKIAMHADDAGMAEHADMFWNRGKGNFFLKTLLPIFLGFGKHHRFTPDILVEDGDDLSEYGLDARVLNIPGHSKGSIGILTRAGNLFCGDLLMSDKVEPSLGFGDPAGFVPSITRLKNMNIGTVYPGHGNPFIMDRVHI